MASKAKADTVAGAREAMENALRGTLQVPKHITLKSEHMPFWHGIIKSRALSDWEEVDLVVAAQLARCQYEIEVATEQLDGEDTVLFNARGTQIMNPRLNVLEQLARREMALIKHIAACAIVVCRFDIRRFDDLVISKNVFRFFSIRNRLLSYR